MKDRGRALRGLEPLKITGNKNALLIREFRTGELELSLSLSLPLSLGTSWDG